jgi:phage terminase large subunit-like protein
MRDRNLNISSIASLPPRERARILTSLTDDECEALVHDWRFLARPNQIAPDGDWKTWLILAGRGFGKTRTGAEWVREQIKAGRTRIGLIAATASDAREVMIEGESGLLSVCWAGDRTHAGDLIGKPSYEPSKRRVTWANGAIATAYSAEEPERLRGPQHEALWCLPAGAMVSMADGNDKRIVDVRIGDLVLTRDGPREVLSAQMTNPAASLWKVETLGGQTLRCTANHRIFVHGRGFVRADELKVGEQLCVIDASNGVDCAGIDMSAATMNIAGQDLSDGTTAPDFTSPSMKTRTDRSRPVTMSTTRTRTNTTTRLATWLLSRTASILSCIAGACLTIIPMKPDRLLPSICGLNVNTQRWSARGAVSRSALGELTSAGSAHHGVSKRTEPTHLLETTGFVSTVVRASSPASQRKSIAARPATTRSTPQSQSNKPARSYARIAKVILRHLGLMPGSASGNVHWRITDSIKSVGPCGQTEPVYDLTVDGAHEFFADGILVHNCDELAAWAYLQDTWDMAMFGLRLGANPQAAITTTPKPLPLLRQLVKDGRSVITKGSTFANAANLAPSFLKDIRDKYDGTRLGRQELNAEILDDVPGALWTREMIDAARRDANGNIWTPPDMQRVVIAIDPSGTKGEDDAGDSIGIVAAGRGVDGIAYILADRTCKLSPHGWGRRALEAYNEFKGDRIVAERNFGGAMVEHVIKTVDRSVSYKEVVASRGKIVRAEPIAALYEQGKVRHIGDAAGLDLLEDQMCAMTATGYLGDGSPDRVDAAVWALTELMLGGAQPLKFVAPFAASAPRGIPG